MRLQAPAALFLTAALGFCSAASAADLEAGLSWKLEFGPTAFKQGADLTLGYRSADLSAPRAQLLRLDLTDAETMARIAGLPLWSRNYRAYVAETTPGEATPADRPWYTRSWVLWTVGGLAGTAALLGSASSSGQSDSSGCTGYCGPNGPPTGASGVTSNDSGTYIGCTGGGSCTVTCASQSDPTTCHHLVEPRHLLIRDIEDRDWQEWLESGNGHMGDLTAVNP